MPYPINNNPDARFFEITYLHEDEVKHSVTGTTRHQSPAALMDAIIRHVVHKSPKTLPGPMILTVKEIDARTKEIAISKALNNEFLPTEVFPSS